MNLFRTANEVHTNAVEHGWWEEERSPDEVIALIHSEWSEALEEYRAGRPMRYFPCNDGFVCTEENGSGNACGSKPYNPDKPDAPCSAKSKKPEGIAVELIDGCIRILDLFGKFNYRCASETLAGLETRCRETFRNLRKETPTPSVIAMLHQMTSSAHQIGQMRGGFTRAALAPLEAAVGMACAWIRMQGCDPEAIMLEKHRYNLTRPYKHGAEVLSTV